MTSLQEFVNSRKHFIIAHRGSSIKYPGNTIEAFRDAIKNGAHIIEVDIQFTSDNVPVACHDTEYLEEGERGIDLTSTSSKDLKKHSLKNNGKEFQIPTLDEVIELTLETETYLVIELKSKGTQKDIDNAHSVYELVSEKGFLENTLFASFDLNIITELKQHNKNIHTAAIMIPGKKVLPSQFKESTGCESVICSLDQLDREIAEDAKKSGIYIGAYSTDNKSQLEKVLNLGIKAIVTNDPEKISNLLATGNYF